MEKKILILGLFIVAVFLISGCIGGEPSKEDILSDPDKVLEMCPDSPNPDGCYFHVAEVLSGDNPEKALETCDLVEDSSMESNCYFVVAHGAYNVDNKVAEEACGKITDVDKKDGCFYEVFIKRDPANSLDVCKKMSDSTGCYMMIADSLKNKDDEAALIACYQMVGEDKSDCIFNVWLRYESKIKDDPNKAMQLCAKTYDPDNCYIYVGTVFREEDPDKTREACSKVTAGLDRDDCYLGNWLRIDANIEAEPDIAMQLCDGLSSNNDECFYMIAGKITDKDKAEDACEKIEDSSVRSSCRYMYA